MLQIHIKANQVSKAVGSLIKRFGDSRAVHAVIAEALYDQTVERFRREESPSGKAWAKLSPLTLAGRRSAQGILRDKGDQCRMMNSGN